MAANGYLMLAICAATESAGVRRWVWRLRAAADGLLVLIAIAADRMSGA
jgi:hypothetical protein